jgi:signal transduction histidine kinase
MIPEDVAQHIFVPFFTTKKEGSGIGLSVARQIMRLSGGTLTLKPEKHMRITTFELVFP